MEKILAISTSFPASTYMSATRLSYKDSIIYINLVKLRRRSSSNPKLTLQLSTFEQAESHSPWICSIFSASSCWETWSNRLFAESMSSTARFNFSRVFDIVFSSYKYAQLGKSSYTNRSYQPCAITQD